MGKKRNEPPIKSYQWFCPMVTMENQLQGSCAGLRLHSRCGTSTVGTRCNLQHGGAFEKAEPGKAEGLTPRFGAYASERYLTKKHLMG